MNLKNAIIVSALGSPFAALLIAKIMRNNGFDLKNPSNQHLLCFFTAFPFFVFICFFMDISLWMKIITVIIAVIAGEVSFGISRAVEKLIMKPKNKVNP